MADFGEKVTDYNPEIGDDDEEVERNIAQWVEDKYKEDYDTKIQLQHVWAENIHFFAGNQTIWFNQAASQLQSITLPTGQGPRQMTNRYSPSKMQVVADLTRTEPAATVLPDANTPDATLRAKLAEKLRYKMWDDLDESMMQIFLALWLSLTGTGVKENAWSSHLGDVTSTVYGPFNLGMPSAANELFFEHNTPWIGKWTIQPLTWVQEMYNQQGEGFYPENAQNLAAETPQGPLYTLWTLRQAIPRLGALMGGMVVPKGDYSILKEIYLQPNDQFPQGRYYVGANQKLLYKSDSPYFISVGQRNVWNPFTVFKYIPSLGRFFGCCPGDDLVPLQRRLNQIHAQLAIVRRKMGGPQWVIPTQAKVPQNYISGDAGLVIRYTGNQWGEPKKVDASNVPVSLWQEIEQIEKDMGLISGDVDVLRAHQPRGARGVQALQLMTEIVSSRRSPTITLWEKQIAKSERLKLLIYKKFAQQENTARLMVYAPEFGAPFIQSFFGDQVPVSLQIEAGSTIPKLQAAQQQQLLAGFKMGLFGPPDDPMVTKAIAAKLGMGEIQTSMETDIRKAELENSAISSMLLQTVDFLPFDNHQIHIQIHTMEVKQPGFKEVHPNSITFMIQHIQMHMKAAAAMQQRAMQQRVEEALLKAVGEQALKPPPAEANKAGLDKVDKPAPSHTNDGGQS